MKLQFVFPKRWFNRLLVVVGMVGLFAHAALSSYLAWYDYAYPVHWTFTILAPICCLLWGLVPRLQLQSEPKASHLNC